MPDSPMPDEQTARGQTARGSFFADQWAAREAVDLVMPMINGGMQGGKVGESGFLYIVIMDPALGPGQCDFEQAILYEHAVGDRSQWDADYAAFARDKAKVCWRMGCDGHHVRSVSPHLLNSGDPGIWGGACIDGIVVGVAGANPWFDEAFAGSVACCLKAVAKERALAAPETPSLGPVRAAVPDG